VFLSAINEANKVFKMAIFCLAVYQKDFRCLHYPQKVIKSCTLSKESLNSDGQ